jgi:hypothetical protein
VALEDIAELGLANVLAKVVNLGDDTRLAGERKCGRPDDSAAEGGTGNEQLAAADGLALTSGGPVGLIRLISSIVGDGAV